MTFTTEDYERTWGKKPRGVGQWAFRLPTGVDGTPGNIVWAYGTLTEAKASIRRRIVGGPNYKVEVLG